MAQVGRNERCPCGSGKKFKHCCLLAQLQPSHESLTARRLGRLADWIAAKFRSQIPAQADEFFYEFDADEREILNSGKHAGANGVAALVTDFICIDAVFELRGVKQSGLDWFLQVSGPISLEDRAFYDALNCSGLRAYRVLSVDPGVGMQLLDLFEPDMESGFVHEPLGSTQIAVGDVIGARLVHGDGVTLTAAMVPFQAQDEASLVENYAQDLASAREQAELFNKIYEENAAVLEDAVRNGASEQEISSVIADAIDAKDDAIDNQGVAELNDNDAPSGNEEFDERAMRNALEEMILQDNVAARVVSTYWLESVLRSLGLQRIDSAANE